MTREQMYNKLCKLLELGVLTELIANQLGKYLKQGWTEQEIVDAVEWSIKVKQQKRDIGKYGIKFIEFVRADAKQHFDRLRNIKNPKPSGKTVEEVFRPDANGRVIITAADLDIPGVAKEYWRRKNSGMHDIEAKNPVKRKAKKPAEISFDSVSDDVDDKDGTVYFSFDDILNNTEAWQTFKKNRRGE